MRNDEKDLIEQAVKNIIARTGSNQRIKQLLAKHDVKLHFIPKNYRVFGGILQSMNIQFGNFIEELMTLIIQNDGRYEIIKQYSGKKSNAFRLSTTNDARIDSYISKCQEPGFAFEPAFQQLLQDIVEDNDSRLNTFKHDIDILFRDKTTGTYYYLEVKYNDDHDTGKFVDINRKFIKTYAYLVRELRITSKEELVPILFFFTNKRLKGNLYVPETTNIRRGKAFFDEFLTFDYQEVDDYLRKLSEDSENIEVFDQLYERVMKS